MSIKYEPGQSRVYLDHAATTPLRPQVREFLIAALESGELHGNSSGAHSMAKVAKNKLEEAREIWAHHLGCSPYEVVFTSGGTESNNLAIAGTSGARGPNLVCTAAEHHSVLNTCLRLDGALCAVDKFGLADFQDLSNLVNHSTRLVSVILVNNETGAVNKIDQLADLLEGHAPNCLLHTDGVQAVGHLDLASTLRPVDLATFSPHKFGGPQGVGVVMARKKTQLHSIMAGGAQEFELRPGTQNVALISAGALALELVLEDQAREQARLCNVRAHFLDLVSSKIDGVSLNSSPEGVASIVNVTFSGVSNEELLILLDRQGVHVSTGASCASGAVEPSHVLGAMGISQDAAASSVRFSFGWSTKFEEIDLASEALICALDQLRSQAR